MKLLSLFNSNRNPLKANEQSLLKQSRSFAIPILALDTALKTPIMVEYNLNKTIDTIEDHPTLAVKEKIALIDEFCLNLQRKQISKRVKQRMLELTPKEEAYVFKNYDCTLALFNQMSEDEKTLGIRYTLEMAEGMCTYLQKEITTNTELNEYCYYVAGTVGLYLTELLQMHTPLSLETSSLRAQRSNPQSSTFEINNDLKIQAIAFGLFLQKLNVIRDFVEDTTSKDRLFWPKQYFDKYPDKLSILNALCQDIIQNDVPEAIAYYQSLASYNQSYNYFMRFLLYSGIEYLKLLQNNPAVFMASKVKLPKQFIQSLYRKVQKFNDDDFVLAMNDVLT